MLPSLSSSYSTSRRRGGDWLLGIDSAGASSSPAAVPAPEMGGVAGSAADVYYLSYYFRVC